MIIVTVTGQVKPEFKQTFIEHMRELAETVRQEEGCISYQQHVCVDDPNHLFLYEQWQSEAHLKAHLATTHMAEHFAMAQPWFDSVEMHTMNAQAFQLEDA